MLKVLFSVALALIVSYTVYNAVSTSFERISTALNGAIEHAGETASGKPVNQR